MKPCTYDQLIYDNGDKIAQWRKTVYSINYAAKTGQLHIKNWIRAFFNTKYKSELKMIKDLNV